MDASFNNCFGANFNMGMARLSLWLRCRIALQSIPRIKDVMPARRRQNNSCMPNLFFLLLLAAAAPVAFAQNFPDKPVTVIAPFPAGGSVDLVARAVAQRMSETWKQPVVVSNRPGAGGNIGAEAVARAAPDGYPLLMGTTALASSPAVYAKL